MSNAEPDSVCRAFGRDRSDTIDELIEHGLMFRETHGATMSMVALLARACDREACTASADDDLARFAEKEAKAHRVGNAGFWKVPDSMFQEYGVPPELIPPSLLEWRPRLVRSGIPDRLPDLWPACGYHDTPGTFILGR